MLSICYNPCNKIQIFLQQILSMEYLFSQNILPNIHIFKSFHEIKNKYIMNTHERFLQLFVNKNEDPLLTGVPQCWQVEQGLTFINLLPESSCLKIILGLSPFVKNCSLYSEHQVTTFKYSNLSFGTLSYLHSTYREGIVQ